MQWQGAVRYHLEHSKYDKIIVGCRKGHELFYEKATEFILMEPNSDNTEGYTIDKRIPSFSSDIVAKYNPVRIFPAGSLNQKEQSFIRYGTPDSSKTFDLIIHARHTNKLNTNFRCWGIDNWNKVVEHFKELKIACIGSNSQSIYVENTTNCMNLSLDELANIFASSKLLVGGSSGPIHFGSLCGIKRIVIGDTISVERYKDSWNPLKVPVILLDRYDWKPPVSLVIETIEKNL
jgi:hypothetical protein